MSRGVDLRAFSADELLDMVETFMINDTIAVEPEESKRKRREMMRVELMRYNSNAGSSDPANDTNFAGYLEPTNDGVYPGLEDGLMG